MAPDASATVVTSDASATSDAGDVKGPLMMTHAILHASDVTAEEYERTEAFVTSLPEGSPVAVVVQHVLAAVSRGVDVSFLESDKELTPNQAADLLNVSRPHLLKIMDRGLLAYRRVGTNRRIAMADLLDYVQRHERGNAYVGELLGTREHSRREIRDAAAGLSAEDLAQLNGLTKR